MKTIFFKNALLLVLFNSNFAIANDSNSRIDSNDNSTSTSNSDNIILVTAEFEDRNVLELPTSVTVISENDAKERNAQHLSDLLNLAPNVNFATGSSRGKFIQIRGIGERSEFQEPVNYSVEVVMDGIDLTGIGLAATTLDIQQTEILRGPQGTLFGANGLAGLINMVSNDPTDSFFARVGFTAEEYGGRGYSAVLSGSISDNSGIRFAVQNYQSDGFIENTFLGRSDTNNIDETSARLKYRYQPNHEITLTATLFYVDVNNGYDAFSLDNDQTTLSDEPGNDLQETLANAVQIKWNISDYLRFESTVSTTDSDISYSYDEDWTNPGICDGLNCDSAVWGFDWWYQSVDTYKRKILSNNIDIRLLGSDEQSSWVFGYYLKDQNMDITREYTYLASPFESHFDTKNKAVYGQYSFNISKKLNLTSGLRFENRSATYSDNANIQFNPNEDMWGGKLSLKYQWSKSKMLYSTISRGYKAGGFNANSALPRIGREFKTETQLNYEVGMKGLWLDNRLTLQASAFYQDRDNIQTKQSLVLANSNGLPFSENNPCPCSFNGFTGNAASGINSGLELQAQWRSDDSYMFYGNIGILQTEYTDFNSFTHIEADTDSIPPIPYDLSGRGQAHSPEHQITVGSRFFINDELTFNIELESKGEFYFSERHNEQSYSYELLNLRLTYQLNDWRLHLYAHNVTDEKIQTRGFGSFPNDPRNLYSVNGPYYQFSKPRVIGLNASIEF